MNLFSGTIASLEGALNYSQLKQETISNNIANVDTPNYKAKNVSFSSVLDAEMSKNNSLLAYKTNQKHFDFSSTSSTTSAVFTEETTSYNESGNNVDVDQQMSELAENQIYYNAVSSRISSKFLTLQNVISGGQ